ncbi:MAG: hypothetical protein ACJ8F7_19700 [Gemmataceae bacterium]
MTPFRFRLLVALLSSGLAGPLFGQAEKAAPPKPTSEDLAGVAAYLEKAYAGQQPPESVRMLQAVLRGSMMGPGDGWFGPGQSRYSWDWLAKRHGPDATKGISVAQFRGPKELFARLDRNRDGVLTADDFDWSDSSPFVRQLGQAQQWLGRADADGDRKLSKAEWDAVFQRAAQGKDYLNADDVRALLFPPTPSRPFGPPPDMPSKAMLLKGLFNGELGSPQEGPKLGDAAPDFTLQSPAGHKAVTLSKLIGPKPVVLIFGSFT